MNVHLVFATPENILFLFVLLSRVCFESLIEKAASPLSSSFVSHSRFCSSDPCCCTTPSCTTPTYDVFLLKRSMFNLVRTSLDHRHISFGARTRRTRIQFHDLLLVFFATIAPGKIFVSNYRTPFNATISNLQHPSA